MTQVSKIPLDKSLENQISSLFLHILTNLPQENDMEDFLEDLLTPTEKIMLGKRLAIAFLLTRNYDHRVISRILKVSTSTVSSVQLWLKMKGKGYRNVFNKLAREEKWIRILTKINATLEYICTLDKQAYPRIPKEEKPRDTLF